ncbi:MAG: hypothetical protein HWD59_09115 [Coxiellaceae bacterium]|nr:MAG: hypothetical protein HWD59_09115 [Coxiellaceae bacterium]
MVKGTGILILAGVANIQPIAVALSTGSNFTQTMLSAIGLMPASLLSTLNLLTLELPALLRKLDGSDKEHKRFNQDLRDAWIYQLKHRNRTVNQAQSLGERWAILLQDLDQAKIDECLGSRVSREIIRGIGLLATGPLSWANFWNLQEVMVAALPWGFGVPGRILGGIVSIGFTYIFGKLVSNLFVGIYDAARNLVLGRAVDSLPLQLINRLVITTVAVGLCAVGTSLSFPTALALFMHAYHLIFKEQLSYEVMAAIDIYHLVGLIECISLVLKAFYAKCGSTQEKSLLRFHEAVEVAEKLNPKEIVAQLKKLVMMTFIINILKR